MFLMKIENSNEEIVLWPTLLAFLLLLFCPRGTLIFYLSTCRFCPIAVIPSRTSKMQRITGIARMLHA